MDNSLIQLIARLKIRLRREKSYSINTQTFFSDSAYASQVLDMAEDSESVELVTMSMDIRERLGLIAMPKFTAPVAPIAAKAAAKITQEKRYMFGARS